LIKRIDKINREIFQPSTILANFDEKQFYICDNLNHRILITDLDFNFIKSVGSKGSEMLQFDGPYPYDIAFPIQSFIYVIVTTSEFKFIQKILIL
jgi:hypothetical protein